MNWRVLGIAVLGVLVAGCAGNDNETPDVDRTCTAPTGFLNYTSHSWRVCLSAAETMSLESLRATLQAAEASTPDPLAAQNLSAVLSDWSSHLARIEDSGPVSNATAAIEAAAEGNMTLANATWSDVGAALEAHHEEISRQFEDQAAIYTRSTIAAYREVRNDAWLTLGIAVGGGILVGGVAGAIPRWLAARNAAYWSAFSRTKDIPAAIRRVSLAAMIMGSIAALACIGLAGYLAWVIHGG